MARKPPKRLYVTIGLCPHCIKEDSEENLFLVITNAIYGCFDSFHGLKDNYAAFIAKGSLENKRLKSKEFIYFLVALYINLECALFY